MTLKRFTALIVSVIMIVAVGVIVVACDKPNDDELPREIPYNAFYDATQWEYMTNNAGKTPDTGELPVSLADGSIRFYRTNQAYQLGNKTNDTISFMLKATHDWSIWLNSSSKDNNENSSYRLEHKDGQLQLVVSTNPSQTAAVISSTYTSGKWNCFDVTFTTEGNVTQIAIAVNGDSATFTAGADRTNVSVEDYVVYHYMPTDFKTGDWFAVKVWNANNYVQLKPVDLADVADVPIVAAIGDSITEGSGTSNSYTESYPAQMQTMLGKDYNVINFGMSGRTARTDLPADNGNPTGWIDNLQWQGVQAIVPDIAIVKLGTNDSKTSHRPATTAESFKAALDYILDELIAVNPDMKIYLCTSAYAYSSAWAINNDNIASVIVPVQRQIAEERNLPLIDMYEITQSKSALFPDGIHPNVRGYTMFAEVLAKVITDDVSALTADFLNDINARYNDPI